MTKDQIEAKHKHYGKDAQKTRFWRDAAAGRFGEVFFRAMGLNIGDLLEEDRYLQRWDKESAYSFTRRAKRVQDPDYCKKIVTFFLGSFAQAPQSLAIDTPRDADQLTADLKDDIDLQGSAFDQFSQALAVDAMVAGRSWLVGDVKTQVGEDGQPVGKGRPYLSIVPREDVWDWAIGEDGRLDYFKFKREYYEIRGSRKVEVERIFIWTREAWEIYRKESGNKDWALEKSGPNEIGEIPAMRIDMGQKAYSIIDNPAKFQLAMMNVASEVGNALSLQCLIMLVLPEFTINALQTAAQAALTAGDERKAQIRLAVNTIIPVSDNETGQGPRYLSPNVGSLDGQFKLLEYYRQTLFSSSSVYAAKDAPESGEAKRIEFTQSVAVLSTLAVKIQEAVTYVLDLACRAAGYEPVEVQYSIDRRFEPIDVAAMLANLIQADAAGLGATAMAKQRKIARDVLPGKYTSEELAQSDAEIDEISSMSGELGDIHDDGPEADADAAKAAANLGKLPLALQQLGNAAADAEQQGDVALANAIRKKMKELNAQI